MTMTKEELHERIYGDVDTILDHCDAISAAAMAGKSAEEIEALIIAMPLYPRVAKGIVMVMGKKHFLEKGYDRTRADLEYGEDWIDKVNAERYAITGMDE